MLSSRRTVLAGLAAVLAIGLAGCSGLTPIYATPRLADGNFAIAYDAPSSRTEQILIDDLALRLPRGGAGNPMLSVRARQLSANLTSDGLVTTAQSQKQMTVTATITLRDAKGKILFSGVRSASADYTTDAQIVSSRSAAEDATANAAHLLADIIRLDVLGALAK